jgi:N-formylglutamate deformylase
MPALPILVSTPHSSHFVPRPILNRMLVTGEGEAALERRLKVGSDRFTDRIFDLPDAAVVLNAVVSRYVADLNRARDDEAENGVIKLADFDRTPWYTPDHRLDRDEREHRLRLHYDPYHAELAAAMARPDIAFFIDGHSMEGVAKDMAPDRGRERPAFCLANLGDALGEPGRRGASCPPAQARAIRSALLEIFADLICGWSDDRRVTLNEPYNGGYILGRYSNPPSGARKPGVMIEVSKALYLDNASLEAIPGRLAALARGFGELARVIARML